MKHLVLSLVMLFSVRLGSDSLTTERRISTLEEQHRNQNDYNDSHARQSNDKIDNNERMTLEHFAELERSQGTQDARIQSLHDTQVVAIFIASLTPLALGWFYFNKSAADHKRNEAILATENRIKALEEKK